MFMQISARRNWSNLRLSHGPSSSQKANQCCWSAKSVQPRMLSSSTRGQETVIKLGRRGQHRPHNCMYLFLCEVSCPPPFVPPLPIPQIIMPSFLSVSRIHNCAPKDCRGVHANGFVYPGVPTSDGFGNLCLHRHGFTDGRSTINACGLFERAE